ncbi:MAG: hypothetical protein R3250_15990 [Melioribacteraceae bacterium]|nr:hypothetical protein [Melioribacteraceae bacterium]
MGQQMAFVAVIVLCAMIFTQILLFRSEVKNKYDEILKRISEIERKLSKQDPTD